LTAKKENVNLDGGGRDKKTRHAVKKGTRDHVYKGRGNKQCFRFRGDVKGSPRRKVVGERGGSNGCKGIEKEKGGGGCIDSARAKNHTLGKRTGA